MKKTRSEKKGGGHEQNCSHKTQTLYFFHLRPDPTVPTIENNPKFPDLELKFHSNWSSEKLI